MRRIWSLGFAILFVCRRRRRPGAADFRRCRKNRRAHRPVGPGCDGDGAGLGRRRANGGRRFRRQGFGQADRAHLRRPSDQARRRRRNCAAMVRRRSRRPDRRCAGLGGGAGGAASGQRPQKALHHPLDRHGRFPRQILLALHHAMGVRHPRARRRHRAGSGQARRRHLVLPHRRLRFRPCAGARRHAKSSSRTAAK